MARYPSSSSARFIETALWTTGPHALSYVHHGLKWVIRDHLLSLVQEFPSLKPSSDHFTHGDGTTVHLLNAKGPLPLAPSLTPAAVEFTIWLHQCYPHEPPLVYLSSTAAAAAADRRHPFVDPSGAAVTAYLQTWQYPHSNLCDLARNLVNVFTLCPPFFTLTHSVVSAPSLTCGGKRTIRVGLEEGGDDRLHASLSCDMAAFRVQAEDAIRSLMSIQAELGERASAIDRVLDDLQREKETLGSLVANMAERADMVRSWLLVNKSIPPAGAEEVAPEKAFKLEDEAARYQLDNEAACLAIDDVVRALDEALQEGAVPLDAYLKKVRAQSREQFILVAKLNKLRNDEPEFLP